MLCEFSRHHTEFRQLSKGQYWMYARLVLAGKGSILAVLCKHSVSQHLKIDTAKDVESFQVMQWTPEGVQFWPVCEGFQDFVLAWFDKTS